MTVPIKPLPRSFYQRPPDVVARALLGKVLIHHRDGERLAGRISEVEAYLGLTDPASHAFIGKTARNAILFGPPGVAYVYMIYGMHYCLNVSCLPDGEPGGVLFRALIPLEGVSAMAKLRGLSATADAKRLAGGPGKLCEALGITRDAQNGVDVTQRSSAIQITDDGFAEGEITVTPRIGITKGADLPLRFLLHTKASNRSLSMST
jgi:DNA-3-methyladenine glycosylase